MTPTDLHYAAGLLEGEGHFQCSKDPKFPTSRKFCITTSMADIAPLERLQQIIGGKIRGPFIKSSNRKPLYNLAIGRHQNCVPIAAELFPLMSPRRQEQIKVMLEWDSRCKKLLYTKNYPHGSIERAVGTRCRCKTCDPKRREISREFTRFKRLSEEKH